MNLCITKTNIFSQYNFFKIHADYVREPPFNFLGGGGAGVFVTDKLFISTPLGRLLKIKKIITCLYGTVLKVNYLFHAELTQSFLFQKYLSPPPPLWRLDSGPLTRQF